MIVRKMKAAYKGIFVSFVNQERIYLAHSILSCMNLWKSAYDVNNKYTLKEIALESVDHHPFLSIELQSHLSWGIISIK